MPAVELSEEGFLAQASFLLCARVGVQVLLQVLFRSLLSTSLILLEVSALLMLILASDSENYGGKGERNGEK